MKKELELKELISIEDNFSLKNKNIVIFGGAGKMSQAFSKSLLSAGCQNLVIVDINKEQLEEISKGHSQQNINGEIFTHVCDTSNKTQIEDTATFIKEKIKKVDVLIYAVMSKPEDYYAPVEDYPSQTWQKALDGNLSGAFYAVQTLLPLLNDSSSVIFISSTYGIVAPDLRVYENMKSNIYGGKYPLTQPAVYPASKAGLIGLARYLAVYLADRDIRVNTLVPGGVYDNHDEGFYKEYVAHTPLKRMAAWTDFNGAILFLASDSSRYMTGQMLVVDGGWSTW